MSRPTLYKSPHPQAEAWPPARSGHLPLCDEPARDVYLASCAQVAAAMVALGFKYAKSKQRCHREHYGFGNTIMFQSSHHNTSGRHVQLWMHATISSRALQSWRAERLPTGFVTEHVAGGMVHLLGSRFALVQWELADPADRATTVADAISFIHGEVLPYFALFEEPATLASWNNPCPASTCAHQLSLPTATAVKNKLNLCSTALFANAPICTRR